MTIPSKSIFGIQCIASSTPQRKSEAISRSGLCYTEIMKAELITIVGILTTIVAILVKVLGLPDQIRKNHLRKSTEGLSVLFFGLGFLSYALWTFYGVLKGDWVLILGQGVGVITMGIIAVQIYRYRKSART
jgi:uncharacterized protein with PQ loop repeat